MDSTIPQEIVQLNLPNIEQVVLAGGGAIEVQLGRAVRLASDIDLVTSLENQQVLRSDTEHWNLINNIYVRHADSTEITVSSLKSSDGRYDIWRWWYDGSRAPRGRIYIDELKENSTQHQLGFYVLKLEYLAAMKQRSAREKDRADAALLRPYL